MKCGDLVRTYVEDHTRVYAHVSERVNDHTKVPPGTLGVIIECDPFGYQYLVHFSTCTGWVSDETVLEIT